MRVAAVAGLALLAGSAACALRFGGARPEELRVVLATIEQRQEPERVGSWLASLGTDVALMTAVTRAQPRDPVSAVTLEDSTWFRDVARVSGLRLSGPSFEPDPASALESALVPIGMAALVRGGFESDSAARTEEQETAATAMSLHHARVISDREKRVDVMVVHLPGLAVQDETRRLLGYIATEVDHDAVVLLALRTTSTARADSIGALLDPAFDGVARCEDQHDLLAGVQPGALRLYYSPIVRVRCDAVRGFELPFPALLARVVLDG